MCGRYTIFVTAEEIVERFEAQGSLDFVPRYNAAPSQMLPIVTRREHSNSVELMKWGIVPFWSKVPNPPIKPINAKCESVATSSMFRGPFKTRRCIVPTTGFVEWKRQDKEKFPYLFQTDDQKIAGMAGLYDVWRHGDEPLLTYTIITTAANSLVESIHDRMPVILRHDSEAAWLDPASSQEDLQALLVPYDPYAMSSMLVSQLINSPKNDSAEVLNSA